MKHFESLAEEREYYQRQEDLRDRFAEAALPGVIHEAALAAIEGCCEVTDITPKNLATRSYNIADAMMEARKNDR